METKTEYTVRTALGDIAGFFVGICLALGLGLSAFLFGMDLWIAVLFALVFAACAMKTRSATASTMAGVASLGLAFSFFLWGFPVWPSAVLGAACVVVIATHFTSSSGADVGSGDQNPIIYIAMIIAIRAFLALLYTEVSALTDESPSFLTWITIFVVGVVPDFPILVNVLMAIVLNGTLIIFLVLLYKRIANPVAN